MDDKTKEGIIIGIILAIIVIAYLYSQGWFAQVIPYFEKFFMVI
ncbi:MAG: hypothetical protein ACP5T6_03550 [Candidatus Micrarchaeia archaeon]